MFLSGSSMKERRGKTWRTRKLVEPRTSGSLTTNTGKVETAAFRMSALNQSGDGCSHSQQNVII